MRRFRLFCHHHKGTVRLVIGLTIVGEIICLVHAGWLEGRYADAYLIGAGWVKDAVREFIALKEDIG